MPPRRADTEEYLRGSALAREIRENIAEQMRELLLSGDRTGSGNALQMRIELVNGVLRDIARARGRQEQARELGLPLAPAVRDEREAREALRSAVIILGLACGEWVAAMDFEARSSELSLQNGSAKRKRPGEETL